MTIETMEEKESKARKKTKKKKLIKYMNKKNKIMLQSKMHIEEEYRDKRKVKEKLKNCRRIRE